MVPDKSDKVIAIAVSGVSGDGPEGVAHDPASEEILVSNFSSNNVSEFLGAKLI